MSDKHSPIIIVGGGAWGLSTALHLNASGHTNVTVFERAQTIPSPYSAAYDLNKIVRPEYEDPFYTDLALIQEAIEGWKTPLFGPYFHQTGYLVATTGAAPPKATRHLHEALATIQHHPVFKSKITPLAGRDQFRDFAWQFTGPLSGFSGYFNRLAGYAHSSDALHGAWLHLASVGVKFVLGESAGKATEVLYETLPSSSYPRVVGIRTADGKVHQAKTTIVAMGAHAASLVPSLGKFAMARCWSVAHVQLTKSECDLLRGIPTTNVRDLGFFFEPDPETRLFKLCPLGAGFTNNQQGLSLPPSERLPAPQDFIPAEDERKLRRLLQEVFPWMAYRPFVDQKLCWFADTIDSNFCIDFVPDTHKSLIILSGDSGHGFKMMPIVGKWVTELLAKGKQDEERWQWRTVDTRGEDWAKAVSWRIGSTRELKDLISEKKRLESARL
ncbi:oxygen oxidoreductase [Aureobasidium pullulans]|nr:oxygen oxidoreductase [Aureobasidium pullulans]THY02807.1 oxygen oxidoreductase [Aureobasidium pullulans]